MTSDACRRARTALGAAALGRIEPNEALALRAHLDGCARCRTELGELQAVVRALDTGDAAHLDDASTVPASDLGDRVLRRVAAERLVRRARARRRLRTGAGALLAGAAVAAALVLLAGDDSGGGTRVDFAAPAPLSARATLRDARAGTEVELHAEGLRHDGYYWLWLTGDDGDRVTAGTFRASAHAVDVTMTAAIPLADTRRVWVTDAQDRVVLDAWLSRT
jgi:anti-sigma factor RsiW